MGPGIKFVGVRANIVGPGMKDGLWGQTLWMLILERGLGTDMGLFNVHIMRGGGVLGQTLGMLIM